MFANTVLEIDLPKKKIKNMTTQLKSKTTAGKHELVVLWWRDAESSVQWEDNEEVSNWADKNKLVVEVGWIIKDHNKYIVICSQVTDTGEYGNKTKIPKELIYSIRKVKLKRLLNDKVSSV